MSIKIMLCFLKFRFLIIQQVYKYTTIYNKFFSFLKTPGLKSKKSNNINYLIIVLKGVSRSYFFMLLYLELDFIGRLPYYSYSCLNFSSQCITYGIPSECAVTAF